MPKREQRLAPGAANPDHWRVTTLPSPGAGPAVVIVSPLASRLRDAAARQRITRDITRALAARGHDEIEVVESGVPDEIRAAAATAVGRGCGTVVVAGGDGTVRDAAGALASSGVDVGIVPCGTGNLYASSIGLPRGLDAAIALLRTGSSRPFDVAQVHLVAPPGGDSTTLPTESITFGAACGTGFDAHVIARTTRDMKRQFGVAAYFIAAAGLVRQLAPQPTAITIDGVRTEMESVVVLVVNTGEALPGVLRPRLPVPPDDGLLHVFVLPHGGILGGVRGAVELMLAEAAGTSPSGAAIRLTGTEVRVEVTPPEPTQIDGDAFPAAWLDARMRPGALRVITA